MSYSFDCPLSTTNVCPRQTNKIAQLQSVLNFNQFIAPQTTPKIVAKMSAINCRYGDKCHKQDCKYNHPPVYGSLPFQTGKLSIANCKNIGICMSPGCCLNHPPTVTLAQCKWGSSCRFIKTCPFEHN